MAINKNHPDYEEYCKRLDEIFQRYRKLIDEFFEKEKAEGIVKGLDGPLSRYHGNQIREIVTLQKEYSYLFTEDE